MSTATKHNQIPSDFPVKVLTKAGKSKAKDPVTCGTCGRSWDDAIATSWTPAPSARCPFEYFHSDGAPTSEHTATQWKVEAWEVKSSVGFYVVVDADGINMAQSKSRHVAAKIASDHNAVSMLIAALKQIADVENEELASRAIARAALAAIDKGR